MPRIKKIKLGFFIECHKKGLLFFKEEKDVLREKFQ